MLPVSEVFETVQGEASWAGTPAVFVRLQGCNVGCPWCDTRHTWAIDPANVVDAAVMAAKTQDAPTYANLEPAHLAACILATTEARHVVITGGEPAMHDLTALSRELLNGGRSVQLETSGTAEIRIDPRAYVTLSPKIGMPGGLTVRRDAVLRDDEIKMPVGKPADAERLREPLAEYRFYGKRVWLQPLSQSAKATALCVDAATRNGWRTSVQTHKSLGVR
ncbi:7-carboxy-7-deazaguanine synthase QueE [Methylobacterium nigriterrae]|uniref:7-carboxy-7-deazaguanine synthase QueE n=1 Tax=Methylobacterium nigriterrae TaxID=3127512 RepID=UPI0030135552